MEKEAQFYEAVGNPDSEFRQNFLNQIPLNGTLISRLVYVYNDKTGDRRMFLNGAFATTKLCPLRQFDPVKKTKVFVYPHSFDHKAHEIYEDLLSSLFDHEQFHIRQWNQHSLKLTQMAIKAKSREEIFRIKVSEELPAYENQLRNTDSRRVSQMYKSFLERMINDALQMYRPLNVITDKKLFYELAPIGTKVQEFFDRIDKGQS